MTEINDAAQPQMRPRKRDVHGWVVLDKPIEMTSTHAVSVVKRAFHAKKAGHAGTLDPLASGLLPIALGEATKTVPFIMDGQKEYRFTVSWGAETSTDDAEGEVVASSDRRPTRADVEAIIPAFTGEITQVPPQFSAIKIGGERAYDLARDGETVALQPRTVEILWLRLVSHDDETSVFEAACGKGTYIRAIARDMGRQLGCHGHVAALRRTRVGPFTEASSVPLATLLEDPAAALSPVTIALSGIDQLQVSRHDATRLMRGQSILLRGRDAPIVAGQTAMFCQGQLVAIGEARGGEMHPRRIFHLGA
jgi:tRNA pseudouridine55 synthase